MTTYDIQPNNYILAMLFNTLIYVFHILSARDTFSFDVAAGTRVIQLRANNLDSMNIWIHTINAVIADK